MREHRGNEQFLIELARAFATVTVDNVRRFYKDCLELKVR
jgi:hypothetical protein